MDFLGEQISIVSAMISGREPSPFASTYADDIVQSFPDMDISDIIDAMKRGRRGEFGVYYKLNGTVLYEWVTKHKNELTRKRATYREPNLLPPIVD